MIKDQTNKQTLIRNSTEHCHHPTPLYQLKIIDLKMASAELKRGLKNVINFERLSNYGSLAPLVLYLPIGVALGLIRCFIFLHICILFCLLPNAFPLKRWILRVMLAVIGLPITTQGEQRLDNKKKIVISNHVTNLDPFILTFLHPYVLVLENASGVFLKNVPAKQFYLPADKDYSDMIKTLTKKVEDCDDPVLFFPEKVKTNGTGGVLKFSHVPFEVNHPIQPVTIQAKRCLFDVNISTFSSSAIEDMFWCLFLPFTLFSIKYLPITEKKKDESNEEFASRVQTNMAKSLNLQPLSYSYTDISQYLKEQNRAKARPTEVASADNQLKINKDCQQTSESSDSCEFQKMVLQVKDVLPDTPVSCIESELRKTHDIDTTITNILEGKVDSQLSKTDESPGLSLRSLSEGHSFKASKFEQSANARQLSFAERKQAMYEAARLKYRVKHGL